MALNLFTAVPLGREQRLHPPGTQTSSGEECQDSEGPAGQSPVCPPRGRLVSGRELGFGAQTPEF